MTAPLPNRPSEVRAWCLARGFHPSRTLGQNFLVDGNTVDAIVAAAGVSAGERVLEVGPGMGALTRSMLQAGALVTAIEKDMKLADLLRESLVSFGDAFSLHAMDMLKVSLDSLLATGDPAAASPDGAGMMPADMAAEPFFPKFVSNLPYSVGTRILIDVCRHPLAPQTCIVMVQKEVADRLAAPPGTPDRGQASVWIQRRYRVEIVRIVPPTCFWPKPEVSSAVVRLVRHDDFPLSDGEVSLFESITKTAFMHRRKQMASIFRGAKMAGGVTVPDASRWLASCGIPANARPSDITMADWCALARELGR
ncbi:MAG: ribosomal RNA small subunit methyltransferase A [Kiritimatiellae bacterium]|nr:ribosomal RNA small subunit methyltransferase A [Kiritimatiellia bacterium]